MHGMQLYGCIVAVFVSWFDVGAHIQDWNCSLLYRITSKNVSSDLLSSCVKLFVSVLSFSFGASPDDKNVVNESFPD